MNRIHALYVLYIALHVNKKGKKQRQQRFKTLLCSCSLMLWYGITHHINRLICIELVNSHNKPLIKNKKKLHSLRYCILICILHTIDCIWNVSCSFSIQLFHFFAITIFHPSYLFAVIECCFSNYLLVFLWLFVSFSIDISLLSIYFYKFVIYLLSMQMIFPQ